MARFWISVTDQAFGPGIPDGDDVPRDRAPRRGQSRGGLRDDKGEDDQDDDQLAAADQ